MTDSEKEQLCGGYKLNGYCANVAGWKNEYASVSPCTGGGYQATWEQVKAAADNGKVFSISLPHSSYAWLGFGCDKDWKMCNENGI